MPEPELSTAYLNLLVERIRADDKEACEELIRTAADRLERLTRVMLRKYPSVRRWEETADVFQDGVLRLMRALCDVNPPNTRAFFGLAAEQIRRQLLDLARHHKRMNAAIPEALPGADDSRPGDEPTAPEATDLDRWTAFHEAVETLPAEEREVVMLTFYHGWSQRQVAELFGIDVRTVRRRWRAACDTLALRLGDELPMA